MIAKSCCLQSLFQISRVRTPFTNIIDFLGKFAAYDVYINITCLVCESSEVKHREEICDFSLNIHNVPKVVKSARG